MTGRSISRGPCLGDPWQKRSEPCLGDASPWSDRDTADNFRCARAAPSGSRRPRRPTGLRQEQVNFRVGRLPDIGRSTDQLLLPSRRENVPATAAAAPGWTVAPSRVPTERVRAFAVPRLWRFPCFPRAQETFRSRNRFARGATRSNRPTKSRDEATVPRGLRYERRQRRSLRLPVASQAILESTDDWWHGRSSWSIASSQHVASG